MKRLCLALVMMVSAPAMAAIQCGNYTMTGDGMTVKHKNGHGPDAFP